MKVNKIISVFALFLALSNISAQPVLLKLTHNSSVAEAYQHFNNNKTNDTIRIPFFDDFSRTTVYPSTSLWLDQNVYVNRTFGKNAPTIGVATFDIINMAGEVYSHASQNPFVADYLTSKPINLAYFTTQNPFTISTQLLFYYETATNTYHPSDSLFYKSGNFMLNCNLHATTYNTSMNIYFGQAKIDVSDSLYYFDNAQMQYVHIERFFYNYYTVGDSIYFSFFYQGKGNGGNEPEASDSLVLQFKVPGSTWKNVWSVKGESSETFKRVMLPIRDTTWLKKGFQFRFFNYGSLGSLTSPSFASNVDFWNIDYVYLNRNRHINDTVFPDVAISQYLRSYIKEPFVCVPWDHYKQDNTLQIDTVRLQYYNFSDDIVNVQRIQKIYNITTQQLIKVDSLGNENIAPFSYFDFKRKTTPNYFPSNNESESIFEITTYLSAPALQSFDYMQWNDTLRSYQVFRNYYAIDDGSAEYGIGLAGTGAQNGQMAMMFKPIVADTLRGVKMYFNRTLNNASQKYFYLTVWKCSKGKPGQIILKKQGYKPEYHGINEFHYYPLDTAIYVNDTIFVGWTQTTTDLLNLGFDLNYDYSSKTFYNLTGVWTKLPYAGTLMIRPVFSKDPTIGFNEVDADNNIKCYPNPASQFIFIDFNKPTSYRLLDITGKIILSGSDKMIDVSHLSNGLYFVHVSSESSSRTFKIMIQHP